MKAIIAFVLAMMLVGVASAGVVPPKSIDNECQDNGFDYGIAKFEFENGHYVLNVEEQDMVVNLWDENLTIIGYIVNGRTISIKGNATEAIWTCDPSADGAIIKAGLNYTVFDGGKEGKVYSADKDISHVTLCRDRSHNHDEPPVGVPEFSNFGIAVVVIACGALFVYGRRR